MNKWYALVLGLAVAIAPSALTYLSSVHWTDFVSPNLAVAVGTIIGLLLKSPVGGSKA